MLGVWAGAGDFLALLELIMWVAGAGLASEG